MRALVVEHAADCPPGLLGQWLPALGADLDVVRPYAGEPLPPAAALSGYDRLIVLGGGMSCWDDLVAPWLPDVRALLVRAITDGVPTLGVCLGAQLLAAACGGRVEPGPAGPELGAPLVRLRAEASTDPLFGGLRSPLPAPQFHQDAIVALPPDAVWLASADLYAYQAFRVARCAWGVQFHPEATPEIVAEWARDDRAVLTAKGCDVDAALAEIVAARDALEAAWYPLAEHFVHSSLALARGLYTGEE